MELIDMRPEGLEDLKEDWEIDLEDDLWIKSYDRGEVELTQANQIKYKDLKEREL